MGGGSIVRRHRDAVLKGAEDFNIVEELIGLYRMSVASTPRSCSQHIGDSGAIAKS